MALVSAAVGADPNEERVFANTGDEDAVGAKEEKEHAFKPTDDVFDGVASRAEKEAPPPHEGCEEARGAGGRLIEQCDVCGADDREIMTCMGCRGRGYCSKRCQRHDWKVGGHKEMCTASRTCRGSSAKGGEPEEAGIAGQGGNSVMSSDHGGVARADAVGLGLETQEQRIGAETKAAVSAPKAAADDTATTGGESRGASAEFRKLQTFELYEAAHHGQESVVQQLLAAPGVEVNQARTDTGSTPLYIAARAGHESVVQQLLAAPGVEVNQARTDTGEAPLHAGAFGGHDFVVRQLLAVPGVEVNQATTDNGTTPLYNAARAGHESVVQQLLAAPEVEVNQARTDFGSTPLLVAAEGGHESVVRQLLAAPGVEVNQARADDGMTPLHIAANEGRERCLALLLECPAVQVNAKDRDGHGVLVHAGLHMYISSGQVEDMHATSCLTSRCLSRVLSLRRISRRQLDDAVDFWRFMNLNSEEPRAAGIDGRYRIAAQSTRRLVLPVLQAQQRGHRRWCGYCLRLTPGRDLGECARCKEVAYCLQCAEDAKAGKPNPCQKAHWKAGHNTECEEFAAARSAGKTDGTGTVLVPEEQDDEEGGGGAGVGEARVEKDTDGGRGASRNGGRRGPGKKKKKKQGRVTVL